MPHVPENLICFIGFSVLAGLVIPVLEAMPPQTWNSWLGWLILPFALLPCVTVFLLRIDRIETTYRYIVGVGTVAIFIAFVCKLAGWLTELQT